MVADGIGESKAWVGQGTRQREYLCSPDGEPVSAVVIVFVATVALVLSALHEPPYTEPYVRWGGRPAEGDSASDPLCGADDMNEYFKDEAEVHALVRGFEKCTIDPGQFKHYQHLAVALWYVMHFPYPEASEKMRRGIQKLAASYGKMGYHETITLFWLMMVRDFAAT